MKIFISISLTVLLSIFNNTVLAEFVAFESGQVRPIAQSPDGTKLFVVNTPDNQIEIFNVNNGSPTYSESVTVGLEPVAIAAYSNNQIWVANYLSDSISIVDVSTSPARVIKTLLVGDEPADIVFAGTGNNRAFITTAHRGQNSPYTSATNPGELTTSGIGRADVWVFDVTNTGSSLGGDPVAIVTLFGDTPKALTVSPDGNTVYAAIFKSGNQTTVISEEAVCDAGETVPCPIKAGEVDSPGKIPAPNPKTISGQVSPEVGMIVKYNGSQWVDETGTDWSSVVRFNLPDKDVFAIDANTLTPGSIYSSVGTVLFNMAVNPVSGKIYVSNTEAINEVRFEGPGTSSTTVQGHLHESRITVIDPPNGTVTPIHLNKHINYSISPAPAGTSDDSLATPKGIAVTSDGNTLYVAAKGSGKIGVFNTATLENNTFTPDSANHITLSAGGPGGLLLDETNNRLYVTTRFDNALSVIDTNSGTEINHIGLHNPEPASVIAGRQFLFDANQTSSNGEASCSSCHIEGDKDELAWDLGDPDGSVITNNNPFALFFSSSAPFHPMKGPMTTQTLRGMDNHGPMHWRGDRSGANAGTSTDAFDEDLAFKTFNVAFEGLLGRTAPLTTAQMQAYTDYILQVTPPPNPIRNLDNSLTTMQAAGNSLYFGPITDRVANCNGCHTLDPVAGFFGTSGLMSFEGAIQDLKVPQLRNMYEKVGMFGLVDIPFNNSGDNGHKGDQIRGFGFTHDGVIDTLQRFHNAALFTLSAQEITEMEQFMFAFDSNLKPIVGQQVTLTNTNAGVAGPRIDLLIARAAAGDADLIVKYRQAGINRGAHRLTGGAFETDNATETTLTDSQLRTFAQTAGQEVTYTAVPLGSGQRLGIDRDADTVFDNDDNCPANANPGQEDDDLDGVGNVCEPPDFDSDGIEDALDNCPLIFNDTQLDTDNDGAGDACDADDDNDGLLDTEELTLGTNPLLADTDGDNLNDNEEVNILGTNPLLVDTDSDGFNDDIEVNIGSDPLNDQSIPADGDINGDDVVDIVDILLATQITLGLKTPTSDEMLRGDVAPLLAGAPGPDGKINTGDLLLIQRKAFELINF